MSIPCVPLFLVWSDWLTKEKKRVEKVSERRGEETERGKKKRHSDQQQPHTHTHTDKKEKRNQANIHTQIQGEYVTNKQAFVSSSDELEGVALLSVSSD